VLHTIKPEYFTISDAGVWSWLNETSDDMCNGYSDDNAATIKANSEEQYVTVSAGYTGMVAFFGKAAQKSSAISTWVNFCVATGFTGVELDWEGYGDWSATDYSNYKTFITDLGNALHRQNKMLMINGPPIYDTKSQGWYTWKYEDFGTLPVDFMSVMAYDYMYDFGCGYPVQPIDWMKSVIQWTLNKYPYVDRIVIGIPSYGYSGTTGSFDVQRTNKEEASALTGFNNAKMDNSSSEMKWEQGGRSNFFVNTAGLNAKRSAIESMGIKAVSVFHLGGNDWFTGTELTPGTAVTVPKPTNTVPKPTNTIPNTVPNTIPNTVPNTSEDTGAGEICCNLCSEMAGDSGGSGTMYYVIAIIAVGIVGILAMILGAALGFRSGQRHPDAGFPFFGKKTPEVLTTDTTLPVTFLPGGPSRSNSESFGSVPNSPAPFHQRKQIFNQPIVDSPDLSQMRKASVYPGYSN